MYLLAKPDNEIRFFRGQLGRTRCPVCGQLTAKRTEDLSMVPIKRTPRLDVTASVDGVCVVKDNAKQSLEHAFGSQLRFQPLQAGLHAMIPSVTVPFDTKSRRTRLIKQCLTCGEYESVVGATPVALVGGPAAVGDGIVRTDIEFGSNDEKSPLFLLGDRAASALSALGLSGCELVPQ